VRDPDPATRRDERLDGIHHARRRPRHHDPAVAVPFVHERLAVREDDHLGPIRQLSQLVEPIGFVGSGATSHELVEHLRTLLDQKLAVNRAITVQND